MVIDHEQSADHQYQRDLADQEGDAGDALEIYAFLDDLEENSLEILTRIAERLLEAQATKGDWPATGDMQYETYCEALDQVVYLTRWIGQLMQRNLGLMTSNRTLKGLLGDRDATIERMVQAAAKHRPAGLVYSTELPQ